MSDRVAVIDLHVLPLLKYPEDASVIATLSLEDKIYWYSSQDPRAMIFLAQNPKFKRFWYWSYLVPLRMKRFAYRIKSVLKYKLFRSKD